MGEALGLSVPTDPKQARSKQTKEKIIQAAILLFQERGYEKSTSNDIAAVAGVSVGLIGSTQRLELDYAEDVVAAVDMNVVMSSEGRFVEVQGTGEHGTFAREELDQLLALAVRGLQQLDALQSSVLQG